MTPLRDAPLRAAAIALAMLVAGPALAQNVAPARPTSALRLPAERAPQPFGLILEDRGLELLRQKAMLDLGWTDTPSLRFGATRFTSEGPWGDVSLRREDGRVFRLWLTNTGEPEPLLGGKRAPRELSLRWSLSGPRRDR
jgi:hypothetical protein